MFATFQTLHYTCVCTLSKTSSFSSLMKEEKLEVGSSEEKSKGGAEFDTINLIKLNIYFLNYKTIYIYLIQLQWGRSLPPPSPSTCLASTHTFQVSYVNSENRYHQRVAERRIINKTKATRTHINLLCCAYK